jgi:uncharacterized protein YbaR (Trm112 family)
VRAGLVPVLACPECRGPLTLRSGDASGGEIDTGVLACTKCGRTFDISSGIPDLLPLRYRDMPPGNVPGAT